MEKLENKPKLIDLINFDKVNVLTKQQVLLLPFLTKKVMCCQSQVGGRFAPNFIGKIPNQLKNAPKAT
jgi:hypothetical protein